MSYKIKRISGGGTMRVMVDQPAADSPDGGFGAGGSFMFDPGDEVEVSEHTARAIMGDPGHAAHFACTPALSAADPVDGNVAAAAQDAVEAGEKPARRRKPE